MLEVVNSILWNIPVAVIAATVAGLLRNVAGWIENAYKDGKADPYEINQLLGTIVKYFASIMLLILGVPVDQAVVGTFVLDTGTSAIKKIGK